jgi:hypothetical protein
MFSAIAESTLLIEGGWLPYALTMSTLGVTNASIIATPFLLMGGASIYLSYQAWEKTRDIAIPIIHQFALRTFQRGIEAKANLSVVLNQRLIAAKDTLSALNPLPRLAHFQLPFPPRPAFFRNPWARPVIAAPADRLPENNADLNHGSRAVIS